MCPMYRMNQVGYCSRHGYSMMVGDYPWMHLRKSIHEAFMLRVAIGRTILMSSKVTYATSIDADMLFMQPTRSLDALYASVSRELELPCSVILQGEPYLINSAFVGLRNTAWVRNVFLPTWDWYAVRWEERGIYSRCGNGDQKSLNAVVHELAIHAATASSLSKSSSAQRDASNLCDWRNMAVGSAKWRQMEAVLANWTARMEQQPYPTPAWHVPPKLTTFEAFRRRATSSSTPYNLMYLCSAFVFENVLRQPFHAPRGRSFRVSKDDAVCFVPPGRGLQVNHHKRLVPRVESRIADFHLKNADARGRMTATFGPAYSADLFMMHLHVESVTQPSLCNKALHIREDRV